MHRNCGIEQTRRSTSRSEAAVTGSRYIQIRQAWKNVLQARQQPQTSIRPNPGIPVQGSLPPNCNCQSSRLNQPRSHILVYHWI